MHLTIEAGSLTLVESIVGKSEGEVYVRFVTPWWVPLFDVGVIVNVRQEENTTAAISVQT